MRRAGGLVLAASCASLVACGDRAARAPSPTWYEWPDRLDYRFEHVAELQRQTRPVQRFETRKVLRIGVRDAQYALVYDSVLRLTAGAGGTGREPYHPEDTLAFYLDLGRRGEIRIVPACDPAVAACAAVLPGVVALELRRLIPGLPPWMAPPGARWDDTLVFDDTSRPAGSRGRVVTTYGPVRDTVIGGVEYWRVGWHAVRQAFRRPPGGAGFAPERPTDEDGLTLIEKRRLIPAFSTWAGAVAAPPGLRAMGIDASGFRARAWLVGSVFDSAFGPERRP